MGTQTQIRVSVAQVEALQKLWKLLPEPRCSFRAWLAQQINERILEEVKE